MSESESGSESRAFWRMLFWVKFSLLIVAFLALSFFIQDLIATQTRYSIFIYLSLIAELCCLMGSFAGLGESTVRWPVCVLGSLLLAIGCSLATQGGGSIPQWITFVVGVAGSVALITLFLRRFSGRLVVIEIGQLVKDALQFQIKDLFIWTTVTAIAITLIRLTWNSNAGSGNQILPIAVTAIAIAVSVVVNIWAMFGRKISSTKTIVTIGTTAVGAALASWLMSSEFSIVVVLTQILSLAFLFSLRKQGFRFVKA